VELSWDATMRVSVIDTEEQTAKLVPHLDAMVGEGLIVRSKARAIRYTRVEAQAKGS
jgi:PII-like signaling protein